MYTQYIKLKFLILYTYTGCLVTLRQSLVR